MYNHKVEYAQRSHTLRYVVLQFVCRHFIIHFTKVRHVLIFILRRVYVFSIGFLNMCSLYNMCRTANLGGVLLSYCVETKALQSILVLFLQHSELRRVAFQGDWIANRMKNSAKIPIPFRKRKLRTSQFYFKKQFVRLNQPNNCKKRNICKV